MAYRPTSLDFINRPNPVEPHTDPHKHPLHADQNHLRLLHDSNNVGSNINVGEPPRKRRKSGDGPARDLDRPTLPAVRAQGEKRLRIPPTLSGLHQPPPDAGILPSISINGLRSVELPERNAVPTQQEPAKSPALDKSGQAEPSRQSGVADPPEHSNAPQTIDSTASSKSTKSRKNKKWTDAETKDLLQGVEKHGIGSWTKILKDPELDFDHRRTALDLKDRFRVCCPDHYKKPPKARPSDKANPPTGSQPAESQSEKPKRTRTTHRKTQAELRDLGIRTGFAKTDRRKRTAYTSAEDDAILRGFRKYGQKWSQIQQDEDLEMESRTPMDLRDRMRNRWPEEYVKAGLKLRSDKGNDESGKKQDKIKTKVTADHSARHDRPSLLNDSSSTQIDKPATSRPEKENKKPSNTIPPPKKTTTPFLLQADDVFWGLPLDADEERVTLDRRILDWPLDSTRNMPSSNIDPLSTLNLPRPNALPSVFAGPPLQAANSAAATLPSLATVTAGSLPFDFGEQLELPSLLEGFGALEYGSSDARAGGQLMPSLDELLG